MKRKEGKEKCKEMVHVAKILQYTTICPFMRLHDSPSPGSVK
jgi:hypothetical protein